MSIDELTTKLVLIMQAFSSPWAESFVTIALVVNFIGSTFSKFPMREIISFCI